MLRGVDWSAPWFAAIAAQVAALDPHADLHAALNAAAERHGLRNTRQCPIRFVASDAAGDEAYEAYIARTGRIPTRTNRHDLFNALVWLAFPRSKARLNALQAAAIAKHGRAPRRGPLRDAATLIDENAILVVTQRDDLAGLLRNHEWTALFVRQRAEWQAQVRPLAFGHALMEKLTAPYKGIAAHALITPLPIGAPLAAIDACVAEWLDDSLSPQRLMPLPVLGIPGWADNDEAAYYDDRSVFRPAHRRAAPVVQPG